MCVINLWITHILIITHYSLLCVQLCRWSFCDIGNQWLVCHWSIGSGQFTEGSWYQTEFGSYDHTGRLVRSQVIAYSHEELRWRLVNTVMCQNVIMLEVSFWCCLRPSFSLLLTFIVWFSCEFGFMIIHCSWALYFLLLGCYISLQLALIFITQY